ncbi:glycoside hydrolase family 68 protein [Halalkaliarchaeum sp. AArc-GB]|uniref:glycoside hydrolase family 68 protein n=1 Tax=Halalkaliarchaeum sp. AArc-GB TaxID=3074078 RepID=UPI00285C108A|nr:glycoside hydrolase family 68 protein [Halalkaliarchaeum sp. AArc-GB]MDR5672965.1 glycoside hydrolase family 68 protein [Halalkaliarchaeum sp. AArc-GB]
MTNQFSHGGGRPSAWCRSQAAGLERVDRTLAPIIYPAPSDPFDGWHIWDTWPVRNRDGTIADIDGYRVIVSLTTADTLLPGKRHDVAELHYFYSSDGRRWTHGGPVFDGGAFGSRQWAGSTLYDDGDLYVFYTATGSRGESELTYTQRIAGAVGGRVTVVPDGDEVTIDGDWRHEVLLEPDGTFYEREDQSRGMIYTFRDPWFFEDPETGETTLLFEANTPVPPESGRCGGDPVQQEFNGSVGMAISESGDPMDWELREPLVDAVCVNQELERPHVAYRNGSYYLFVSSHKHTFAPGIEGFDGLYGFVGDDLRGPYCPLNGHGLVATNPANAPFQAYSWIAYLHREELLVASFFNYYDYVGESLDGIAELPESEQLRRFGGTLAPTLRIQLDGDRTRILGTLDHGHLPLPSESLPELRSFEGRTSRFVDAY